MVFSARSLTKDLGCLPLSPSQSNLIEKLSVGVLNGGQSSTGNLNVGGHLAPASRNNSNSQTKVQRTSFVNTQSMTGSFVSLSSKITNQRKKTINVNQKSHNLPVAPVNGKYNRGNLERKHSMAMINTQAVDKTYQRLSNTYTKPASKASLKRDVRIDARSDPQHVGQQASSAYPTHKMTATAADSQTKLPLPQFVQDYSNKQLHLSA